MMQLGCLWMIPTIVDYKYEVILPTDQMRQDEPLASLLQMWMSFWKQTLVHSEEEYLFTVRYYYFSHDVFTKLYAFMVIV